MVKAKSRILILLPVLLSTAFMSVAVNGQTAGLRGTIDQLLNNYPSIHQRQSEVLAAKARIRTVNDNRLPSLVLQEQLNAGTANSIQGYYFPLGIVPSGSGSAATEQYKPNPGSVSIALLQWELCNFGYFRAQTEEAQTELLVSEASSDNYRYHLVQTFAGLYIDWLKRYRLYDVARRNMERARLVSDAIVSVTKSGLRPGVDSSTAVAAMAEARIGFLQAADDLETDRIAIASFTGSLPGSLVPDTLLFDVLTRQTILPAPGDSVRSDHPLLKLYESQYEQHMAQRSVVSHRYMPKVLLDGAGWMRSSGISSTGSYPESLSSGMPFSRSNYLLGLSLTYNISDIRHRQDQLKEAKYSADASMDALSEQRLQLQRLLSQANATYKITMQKLATVPAQVSAARNAYMQQMALFRAGLSTMVDVTNAQYVLLQAETNMVLVQDDLLRLLFIEAGASGRLFDLVNLLNR